MIIELFFDVVFSLISGLLNLIPPMPDFVITKINSGIMGIVEVFDNTSFIVPWGTLMSAFLIWFAFLSIKLVKDTVDWLISKIPFVG